MAGTTPGTRRHRKRATCKPALSHAIGKWLLPLKEFSYIPAGGVPMAHAGSGRENGQGKIIHPLKEDIIMATNSNDKTSNTGKSSTTQDQQNQQSGKQSGSQQSGGQQSGTQGGTHEQHVEAGHQSHKNDMDKGSASQQSGQKGASQQ